MSEQRDLLEPFPSRTIKQVNKGFGPIAFVSWTDKIQRLLQVCGGFDWTVSSPFPSGDDKEPVGVIGTLEVLIDGTVRRVSGIGTDRDAKKAETDAFSRCCAKIGLGLHLWTQGGDKDGGYWIVGALDRPTDQTAGDGKEKP